MLNKKECFIFRRKLVPGRVVLLGHEIDKVDWAEPENEVDEEIMATVRKVSNLIKKCYLFMAC
jgi:hypothetical protein